MNMDKSRERRRRYLSFMIEEKGSRVNNPDMYIKETAKGKILVHKDAILRRPVNKQFIYSHEEEAEKERGFVIQDEGGETCVNR